MASLRRFQQDPIVRIYRVMEGFWMMKFTHKDVWWGPFKDKPQAVTYANMKGYDIQKN